MMFEPGNLLYFDPFIFPDGGQPKVKYFLVLADMDNGILLASLPTSKDHVPADIALNQGCVEMPERMVNVFVILAGQTVTDNGFSFKVNTFIYGSNIRSYDSEVFLDQEAEEEVRITLVGKLEKRLFDAIKDCLRNSVAVRKNYKRYL